MRYAQTVEICSVCKKKFYGMPINVHGSYEYIHHTNFSNNIASATAIRNLVKNKDLSFFNYPFEGGETK